MRLLITFLVLGLLHAPSALTAQVDGIRLWSAPDHTRLVFDVSGPVDHKVFVLRNPDRVVVDMENSRLLRKPRGLDFRKGLVTGLRDWLPPYQLARSLCLFAAAAAEVAAVDTVYTDFRDPVGLARFAANARRDGFSGMLAIHPGQVETINRTFVPSAAELERAERIVALFDQNPGAGTLGMDGQMIDRPHLIQAQRLLRLARRLAGASNRLRVFNHE